MWRIARHPLALSLATALGLYVTFAYLFDPPLPRSLLIQYMIICIVGILMVATFDDATARRMAEPIAALLGDPALRIARGVAFVAVVLGATTLTYHLAKPNIEAPVELRTVHPAPPSTVRVYGKTYNLLKLQNPLRAKAPKGSDAFKELVGEGGKLYYRNCLFCHGDVLDGRGHFAKGFNPRPANFQDVGTIAQLQESYLFWRITTGGPGLPREGAPWASAMPVWHEMLSEDEVWKIILFLYDATGHVPRSWDLESAGDRAAKEAGKADHDKTMATDTLDDDAIKAVYDRRCAHCHGEEGDGQGPAAEFMYPLPRDFTLAVFKYKDTHADDEFPTDANLRRTIEEGLAGTAMPGWKGVLSDKEIDGLIELIKSFGGWDEEEIEHRPIDAGERVASSPQSIARGRKLFVKACVQCHGDKGRGNVTSGKKLKDDWRNRIWPRNLTRPSTWRWTHDARDVFERISTGIRGTPMPEHTTTVKIKDRWDIANYVMTLRDVATPPAPGRTVIRAVRIDGALPGKPDDPAWEKARPITFALVPNVIKEKRLFFSLNDMITVRALFNGTDIVIRLDVDDRTYSVPGDKLEMQYRIDGVEPTPDAVAVQLPKVIPTTSEKPWFRHGDRRNPVTMWYWRAPSVTPKSPETTLVFDAAGPNKPPRPRKDPGGLTADGTWHDGQWRIVMRRPLKSNDSGDLSFEPGRYIPIAFANWDGVAGQSASRHSFTSWYWLLLEPETSVATLYATTGGGGLLAGLLFLAAVRRQRGRHPIERRQETERMTPSD